MATSAVHRKGRFLGQTVAKKVRKKEGRNSEKNGRRKLSETAAKMDAKRSCVEPRQGTLFSLRPHRRKAKRSNVLLSPPPDGPGRLTTPRLNHGRKGTPQIKDVISTELGTDLLFLTLCPLNNRTPYSWVTWHYVP